MNLVIFGASGSIGRPLTAQALAAGHTVTTFSRTDTPIEPDARHLAGNVLDPAHVKRAVEGQDAVLIVLGNGTRGNLRGPATANIIAAMQAKGVRRLVCQSTLGAGDSYGALNFYWKYIMFGLLLRPVLADHNVQEGHVRASGLDWTILRPAAFTDGPMTGTYSRDFAPGTKGLSLKIARADVAHCLLALLDQPQSHGKAIAVSN